MGKGFEWSVNILGALVLAVVAAGIVFSALSGSTPPVKAQTTTISNGCSNDNNCASNLDGSRCLMVYSEGFTPFCGCLTNDDCSSKRSGACGSNERCV